MMTFIYDNLKEMYEDSLTGNMQLQLLIYLEEAEELLKTKIEENNLYEHFDAQIYDFYLDDDEINNPEYIDAAPISKEAALHLHKMIGLMYAKFRNLSPSEKEKLRIYSMIDMLGGYYRSEALKNIYQYSKKELEKLDQLDKDQNTKSLIE